MPYGQLFVISAPSGAGKTSLIAAVLEGITDLAVSISHTTRALGLVKRMAVIITLYPLPNSKS